MSANAVPPARATTLAGAVSSASGSSSPSTIHTIAPAANPKPDREDRLEAVDEQERGNGEEWLRQAREDAPSRRGPDRGATRNEDKADREPLGDVVHRDRDRDQQTKRRSVGERSSDPDSFGRGMDCHHADDQQRPPRVLAPQRSHRVSMVVLEVALRHEHEADSQRNPHRGAPQAAIDALQRKARRSPRASHRPRLRSTPPTQTGRQSGRRKAAARQARSPTPSPEQQRTP